MRRASTLVFLALLSTASLFASDVAPAGIAARSATSRLLIPAAGSLQGAQGTFFRSDIRITNLADSEQLVEMIWLPREGWETPPAVDPEAGTIVRVTLQPYEMLHSDDFITEVLRTSGLGAILVTALLPDGSDVDLDGVLQASSRIWSPQPGAEGTVSQSLPAVPLTEIVHENAVILGHRRDFDFRTNVGIVNLDNTDPWTFRVIVSGETPTLVAEIYEVTVPPYGISLVPVLGVDQTRMFIHVEVVPSDAGVLTLWHAFASTVDNRTGDAWSSLAFELPR